MPPLLSVTLLRSLELIRDADARRNHLGSLVALLRERLRADRWRLLSSETAIQPLVIGGSTEAMAVSEALARTGLLVPAIRPPTVPQGTARLRISLSAAHAAEDVERLCAALDAIP
jgi:8-amino-7-oxononanoate synthase